MATDAINDQATTDDYKPNFSDKDQVFIDNLIKQKMGKAGAEAKARAEQLETDLRTEREKSAELTTKLKAAETSKGTGDGDEVQALKVKLDEIKTIGLAKERELETIKRALQEKDSRIADGQQALLNLKKQHAITESASKVGFFNAGDVATLTAGKIVWSEEHKTFVVLNDHGAERLNSAMQPMSLDEFYTEYAAKNPYMVRGDVKGGTGSSDSNRGVDSTGRFKVDQIFGPKSNPKAANDLKKSNPQEYSRLREVAIQQKLI